jgi:CheY-like chemotaxis protein
MGNSSAGPTVVVIEDNCFTLSLLGRSLEGLGFQTVMLSSGADVVEQARQHQAVLVLTDINMPEVTGIEAARALKDNSDTKDIPIYAFTAYEPKSYTEDSEAPLFAGVLKKPISRQSLKNVLTEVGLLG